MLTDIVDGYKNKIVQQSLSAMRWGVNRILLPRRRVARNKKSPGMNPWLLHVGTHRRAQRADSADIAFGVYSFALAPGAAAAVPLGLTETNQPGWFAGRPGKPVLYAVNEVRGTEGRDRAGVSAFRVGEASGRLHLINSRPTPGLPCHCQVDATGRYLAVASHAGGSVHLFPLEEDGRLGAESDAHRHAGSGPDPRRQAGPHPHAVNFDRDNRFLLVPDLGADRIFAYELDRAAGRLIPVADGGAPLPPGSGPRHLAFDAGGGFVYLMCEMSARIAVFAYDRASARLRQIQDVDALPDGFDGYRSGAALVLHPSGRFLYATTRSHGSSGRPQKPGLDHVAWFEIDRTEGTLRPRGRTESGGEIARAAALDPASGRLYVANQGSGSVVPFRIDPLTGEPKATGEVIRTPVPVCLHFMEHG
jgi:6-phosphogluconolactonase